MDSADDFAAPASAPESWLAEAAAAPAVPFELDDAETLAVGVKIGERYEIEGLLGFGGMGVVYRARDVSLDRSVALKLHRWGDERSRDRLLREAKVMAQLSHPNVLAVHEVGTWCEHVFLAAELVEGQTARQWHKQDHRWTEVVSLYIAAGEGLAAAHHAGLVHRDFKPDNVLVGSDGRVRVADFGLARAAGSGSGAGPASASASASEAKSRSSAAASGATVSAMSSLTRTGARVGTPAYMSPEQFMGEELDGRADQFGFCVSMFEALFRERPFAGRSAAALAAAIGRGPLRPQNNIRIPGRLRAAYVRGLQPDPNDRFATMDELLVELRASLRPRRRWVWGVGAAATVGVFAVALNRNNVECDAPLSTIDGVWNETRAGVLAERYVSDGAADGVWPAVHRAVNEYADAWTVARGEVCRSGDVMSSEFQDRAYACLDSGRRELGSALANLEHGSAARRQKGLAVVTRPVQPAECRDAGFVLASVAPPTKPADRARVSALQDELAALKESALRADTIAAAQTRLEEIELEVADLDYPPLLAELSYSRGIVSLRAGDSESGVAQLRDAYFGATAAGDHRMSTLSAIKLARQVGFAMGQTGPGILWGRHAVTAAAQGGVSLALTLSAEHNLGILHDTAGDWNAADALYLGALERLDLTIDGHRQRRAEILVSVAALQGGRGQVDAAIASAEESIALYEELYNGPHEAMMPAIGNIGYALGQVGRYREAYAWHERALAVAEAIHGGDHFDLSTPMVNLAVAAHGMGDLELARSHYGRAEKIAIANFGETHPDVALVAQNLAMIEEQEGNHAEAARLRLRAVRILTTTLGPKAPGTLGARSEYGKSQLVRGDLESACTTFDEIAVITSHMQGQSTLLAQALLGQGECAMRRGDATDAVAILNEAERVALLAAWAPGGRAVIQFWLARALWAATPSRPDDARAAANRARQSYEESEPEHDGQDVLQWLADHPAP